MDIKKSLVLEGGGMRGAYTAGALSWLIDNNIEFDNAYGISTGAVHLCNYLLKDKKSLFDFSTKYISDKNAIGTRAILRCKHLVDYDYLFNNILIKKTGFSFSLLNNVKANAKIGIYELEECKTIYHKVQNINVNELKAACSLPLLGKTVVYNNKHLLDGGITDMIPIQEAVNDGCNKHLIITTKPKDYVRKPSKKAIVELMRIRYKKYPCIANDYAIRHENYYKQISLINDLQDKNDALYIYPSESSNVSRLGGSIEELEHLFELGRKDMEAKKDIIISLFK